ncbi:hypothetical protein BDV26DRAFT_55140 [Aspergillus bertholletiae]|uniref:Uncharacterized protein n=1 Tax=Aspergillus bertholletiae TaxID=1226010 RepID=A0A5N7AVJ0_9EURO|nr:hypothetical protein BDV26DRAFT_55140 [Aspergillus bertholletiae]
MRPSGEAAINFGFYVPPLQHTPRGLPIDGSVRRAKRPSKSACFDVRRVIHFQLEPDTRGAFRCILQWLQLGQSLLFLVYHVKVSPHLCREILQYLTFKFPHDTIVQHESIPRMVEPERIGSTKYTKRPPQFIHRPGGGLTIPIILLCVIYSGPLQDRDGRSWESALGPYSVPAEEDASHSLSSSTWSAHAESVNALHSWTPSFAAYTT